MKHVTTLIKKFLKDRGFRASRDTEQFTDSEIEEAFGVINVEHGPISRETLAAPSILEDLLPPSLRNLLKSRAAAEAEAPVEPTASAPIEEQVTEPVAEEPVGGDSVSEDPTPEPVAEETTEEVPEDDPTPGDEGVGEDSVPGGDPEPSAEEDPPAEADEEPSFRGGEPE